MVSFLAAFHKQSWDRSTRFVLIQKKPKDILGRTSSTSSFTDFNAFYDISTRGPGTNWLRFNPVAHILEAGSIPNSDPTLCTAVCSAGGCNRGTAVNAWYAAGEVDDAKEKGM